MLSKHHLNSFIGLHFNMFLGFLDIGFLFLWSCHYFDMPEDFFFFYVKNEFFLWEFLDAFPSIIKWFYKFKMTFCGCFIFIIYELMELISNSLTAHWTYSVGLIFVFKTNCFSGNLCALILILVISWHNFGFDSFK